MTDRENGSSFSSHEEMGLKGIENTPIKKAKYLFPEVCNLFQILAVGREVKTPKHGIFVLSDEGW